MCVIQYAVKCPFPTQWCGEVASAAEKLPFLYYHFPKLTGVTFAMDDFIRRIDETQKIPTFQGLYVPLLPPVCFGP